MKKILLSIMAIALGLASIAQEQAKEQKGQAKGQNKEWKKDKKEKKEKESKDDGHDVKDGKEFKEFKGRGHAYGRVAQELNLSDAQKQQMKTINESFRNKMQSLKNDQTLSEEAKQERRKQLAEEHRTQVLAILTPEQRKQLEEKTTQGGKMRGKRFDKEQRKS